MKRDVEEVLPSRLYPETRELPQLADESDRTGTQKGKVSDEEEWYTEEQIVGILKRVVADLALDNVVLEGSGLKKLLKVLSFDFSFK